MYGNVSLRTDIIQCKHGNETISFCIIDFCTDEFFRSFLVGTGF